MGKEVKFSVDSIELGNVPYDSKHTAIVKVVENPDEVDYVENGSCSCTKVSYNPESAEITVDFDVEAAIGQKLKHGESSSRYRYVDVYLDKEEHEFVANPRTYKRTRNEKKRSIRIPINFIAFG